MDALTLTDVLCATHKNLVNFGPLTPEFTTLIWKPFRRQMDEIEKSSYLSNDLTDRHEIWHGDAC